MITAYPVTGKAKSIEICRAFATGCGGFIAHHATVLAPGPAFFYGVDLSNVSLYREARTRGDYYYCDNSYFDSSRQTYFRITKDRLQHTGEGKSDGKRWAALGLTIEPWRNDGDHVVVCPQSNDFMHLVVGASGNWCKETVEILRTVTKRPIRVREWDRDKAKASATLPTDLKDAYALVTWSSAAAVTALLAGVPVVAMSPESACAPMSGRIYGLHDLPRKYRGQWAGVLADNQFSMEEMRNGIAWRMLNAAA